MNIGSFRHWRSVLVISLTSFVAPTIILAQPSQNSKLSSAASPRLTSAERSQAYRQIVAVNTITIMRNRGVLDTSQLARIDELQEDLDVARLALAAATTAGASSAAALVNFERAHSALQQEAELRVAENTSLRAEIEAIRADTFAAVAQLSDEEVRLRVRAVSGESGLVQAIDALARTREAAVSATVRRINGESRRSIAFVFAGALSRGDSTVTSSDVLAKWEEAALVDPTVFQAHIERAYLARAIGNLARARTAAEDAIRSAQQDWERSAAQFQLGDIALVQNDYLAARQAFSSSEAIYRRLSMASPEQSWLSISHAMSLRKLGYTALREGDEETARAVYTQSLTISQALSQANPTSKLIRQNLQASLQVAGDMALEAGDLTGAQSKFEECIILNRALLAADVNSVTILDDLATCLRSLAELASRKNDMSLAQLSYNESLGIARRLVSIDSTSVHSKRSLSFSLNGIGKLAEKRMQYEHARAAYSESLTIRRTLSTSDPQSEYDLRQVYINLTLIGDLEMSVLNFQAARAAYHESLAIARVLYSARALALRSTGDLIHALELVGHLAHLEQNLNAASLAYNETLALSRALSEANPRSFAALHAEFKLLLRLGGIPSLNLGHTPAYEHLKEMKRNGLTNQSDELWFIILEALVSQELQVANARQQSNAPR